MAENQEAPKLNLSYDWNKLELAQVAQSYLKTGDENGMPLAKKSLELMLEDIGAEPVSRGILTDPEVAGKTINNYLREYSVHKADQTIKDFIAYHGKNIEKYVAENTPQFQEELAPFMDKKYGDILMENEKAKHILKGKEEYGLGSDKDVEDAKKTVEKYEKVITTITMLEGRKLTQLRNRVEDEVTKNNFKMLYAPKKEGEGEN